MLRKIHLNNINNILEPLKITKKILSAIMQILLQVHNFIYDVATLALGSRPRWRLVKVWAKNEARESHFMLSRV